MTAYNLAVIFAPNLLRTKNMPSTMERLAVELKTGTAIVELMIERFIDVFESKEKFSDSGNSSHEDDLFMQKLHHGSRSLAKQLIVDSKRGSIHNWVTTNEEIERVQRFLRQGESFKLEETISKNEEDVNKRQMEFFAPPKEVHELRWKGGIYKGEVKNNLPHGKGVYTAGNIKFEGQFVSGERTGFGRLVENDGTIYEGEFRNDQKSGKGIVKFSNGNSYEGEFLHHKANGYGEYYYASGATYKGNWKDDLFHGKGIYSSDESRYEGDFKYGKRDGIGCFLTLKGNLYMGSYKAGLMHGYGVYTFHSGDKYEGNFVDGKFNGIGTYTYRNGLCQKGEFKDGKPVKTH